MADWIVTSLPHYTVVNSLPTAFEYEVIQEVRAKAVGSVLPGSTVARMGRFGCAYGIGGLLNTSLTKRARDWAEATYCSRLLTKKTRLLGRRPSDGPPLA